MEKFVGVFCSASSTNNGEVVEAAYDLGKKLISLGYKILFGGGTKGLSEALLKSAIEYDRSAITAVVQENEIEAIKSYGIKYCKVSSIAERKDFILSRSEKVFVLSGGIGTFDEIVYTLAMKQSGIYSGKIILFDPFNYWDFLDNALEKMANHNFISPADRSLFTKISQIDDIE